MANIEAIKEEIKALSAQGYAFILAMKKNLNSKETPSKLYMEYEGWYTKSLEVIQILQPNRVMDFVGAYKNEKRKAITISDYVISDALKGITFPFEDTFGIVFQLLIRQVKILDTCLDKFESKIYSLQSVLQADVFDSELDSAKYLLKNGFLRASGAICGVILEKHLGKVCENRNIKLVKNPKLANYNDALKDNAYDMLEWRRMQRLADLRNLCDHDKQREPTKEEVEELISGTDRVIKTII